MVTEANVVNQAATQARKAREIVVGVDESDASQLALIWAVEEAVCRQAPLRVVTVFESAGRFGDRYGVPIPVSDEEIARREEVVTRKIVDEVLGAAESRRERPAGLGRAVLRAARALAGAGRPPARGDVGRHGRLATAFGSGLGAGCVTAQVFATVTLDDRARGKQT